MFEVVLVGVIRHIVRIFSDSRDELNKPASQLYVHNLTCTLEAAVRATNAQFEPSHVLARLHVNLYPNCKDNRLNSLICYH